ncbi:hypothetical protein PINS_up012649 [Pythium insidiosum]|nr:hypothetical protein PINS_up012649 [Pythium insidiosum]
MGEPEVEEQTRKPQDEVPTEPVKVSEETPVVQKEAEKPATEVEVAAPDSTDVKKAVDEEVDEEATPEKEKEKEAETAKDANKANDGASTATTVDVARESSTTSVIVNPNVEDSSVDALTQAISNVSLHNSSYHRYDDGTVEVGAGFAVPGKYISIKGNVHDTSKPPPQPCFNCQGDHWRKDCPWRREYNR